MDCEKIYKAVKEWEKAQKNQTSAYEYEKSFDQMWQKLGQEIFQQSLGEVPKDKSKKNFNQ